MTRGSRKTALTLVDGPPMRRSISRVKNGWPQKTWQELTEDRPNLLAPACGWIGKRAGSPGRRGGTRNIRIECQCIHQVRSGKRIDQCPELGRRCRRPNPEAAGVLSRGSVSMRRLPSGHAADTRLLPSSSPARAGRGLQPGKKRARSSGDGFNSPARRGNKNSCDQDHAGYHSHRLHTSAYA